MTLRLLALLALLCLTGCSATTATKITRYSLNPWEKDIGYAQVVQAGHSYYISGVVCAGPGYPKAVADCYQELASILERLSLSPGNIVKENVYARDLEVFKTQIEQRKQFYGGRDYPAATWIQADRFYLPEHVLEIELVAVK
jgi:enamine deaminase RidA (YjgF/YER057c/UK114 family)